MKQPLFFSNSFGGILSIVIVMTITCFGLIFAAPVDPNFTKDQFHFENGKTKIDFDSAGRLYLAEKQGRVLVFNPDGNGDFQAPSVLLDLTSSVNADLEGGLLGLEIDPDHANNRFLYLFYTTANDQQLVRYTMNSSFSGIEANSATTLLSGLPRDAPFHKAGDIGIHPLDPFSIFVTLGDDGQVYPDPLLCQNLNSYVGKILRIDTSTGLGLRDNPHFTGDPDSIQSRIWAVGFRNPFRFVFHPTLTDTLYVSENGDSTDRVVMVKAGGNGLWNGDDDGGFLTANSPTCKVLHTFGASMVGIEIVTSGPFAFNGHPTLYQANWHTNTGIRRFTLTDSSDPAGVDWDHLTPIPGDGSNWWERFLIAVDLKLGADGHLYYCSSNGGEAFETYDILGRYRFEGGDPPNASFSQTPINKQGPAPLPVAFSDTSTAGTHPLASWSWDFGDGNHSQLQNPNHTYTSPGSFTASLTVTDTVGLSSTSEVNIAVVSETQVSLNLTLVDARSLPPQPATGAFTVSFLQGDGITPLSFLGGSGSHENQINIGPDAPYTGILVLPLTGPEVIMRLKSDHNSGFQEFTRGLLFSMGQANQVNEIFHLSSSTISGRVLTHQGEFPLLDIGVRIAGPPSQLFPFGGARDYFETSSFPLTGIPHRISVDELGFFSIPIPSNQIGQIVQVTYAEEIGRSQYATHSLNIPTQADTNQDASFTVGKWRGGPAYNLSSEAYTPDVPYSAIQEIFDTSCIGCHRATTTNNGGLDLTSGNSLQELVAQPSLFVPGLKLVEPGEPSRSYLFEKINSAIPQQGAGMRPSDQMPLDEQALIRDWILQLAPSYENYVASQLEVIPGTSNTLPSEDINGDGTPNAFEYLGLKTNNLSMSVSENEIQGSFQMIPNANGLTLIIEASDSLAPGSWWTAASRIRGQSIWRVAPGFTMPPAAPGSVSFVDSISENNTRFYRFGIEDD